MCNASTDIGEKCKFYVIMHCFGCNHKVCRQLDDFAIRVSKQARNTNSEISEHDGFKLFPHGFAGYIRNENRVDGGWHLSMTRHLHVWLCTSNFLTNDKKLLCSTACSKLYEVDEFLRWPVKKTNLAYYSVLIDELLEIIVELCRPYVKKKGNSFKFHWPRHWVSFRLNLGCAADEKSLERKLAETQKKFYRFTNGKDKISDQISKKNMQAWTLRDVLHAGGLRPMEDIGDMGEYCSPSPLKGPLLVGHKAEFQIQGDGKGLPMSLSVDVRRVLLRAIKRDIDSGVLQWRTPITMASSMSLSLRNRLAPTNSKKRYVRLTLRGTKKFHGKAIWDCVKFAVEGFDSTVKIFFGRCLAFFKDAIGDHYIAIRWFEACNGDRNVIDPIVQMPRLQEACITATTSYGVMPVTALLNGALLIPNGDLFYALQSPREQDVYITRNS